MIYHLHSNNTVPTFLVITKKNDAGKVVKRTVDHAPENDRVNSIEIHEYDEKGNKVKSSFDRNGDCKPDYIANFEYDENGNMVKATYDKDGDGKPDKIVIHEYDEYNREVKILEDRDADNRPDIIKTNEYSLKPTRLLIFQQSSFLF